MRVTTLSLLKSQTLLISLILPKSWFEPPPTSGKPQSDDKEQAVDKEGSDTESAEDSNSATKVTANGVEQNGNTPKVRIFPLSSRVATDQVCFDNEDQISLLDKLAFVFCKLT